MPKAKVISRPGEPGSPFPTQDPRFAAAPAPAPAAPAPAEKPPSVDDLPSGSSLLDVAKALGVEVPPAPAPAAGAPAAGEQPAAPTWNDPAYPERPEGIPEKFSNMADFVKSYGVLEGALHRRGQLRVEQPAAKPGAEGDAAKPDGGEEKPAGDEKPSMGALLTPEALATYSQEWAENGGQLTEATLLKLEAGGIPREVVSRFIGNEVNAMRSHEDRTLASVGLDRATFGAMSEWAAAGGLDEAANEAINAGLGGNAAQQTMALAYLRDAFHAANPSAAKPRLAGRASVAPTVNPIVGAMNIAAAVGDPRYGHDMRYTQEVQAAIAAGQRAH